MEPYAGLDLPQIWFAVSSGEVKYIIKIIIFT